MRLQAKGLRFLLGPVTVLMSIASVVAVAGQEEKEAPEPAPLGKAAAIDIEGDWIWVEGGSHLLREPDPDSGHVALVEVRTQLPVVERREVWVRVRYGSLTGWFSTGVESVAGRPPASSPAGSARRVIRAREIFGLRPKPASLGGFALYTDVTDERLLKILSKTSRQLPSTYQRRYGLEARPRDHETILLFAGEPDYRAFTLEDAARVRPDLRGHATPEIAVLYVGDNPPESVAAVLVHELTHLLNRRIFETPMPPWLEEGLANDLAYCRVDSRGRTHLGSLGGRSVMVEQPEYDEGGFIRIDRRVHLSGPVASLKIMQERWRRHEALSLEVLTALAWSEFAEPPDRDLHYSASAFFIRYLLDGGDGGSARGFRAFLRSAAADGLAGTEQLVRYLDRSIPELDECFATWIAAQRLPS